MFVEGNTKMQEAVPIRQGTVSPIYGLLADDKLNEPSVNFFKTAGISKLTSTSLSFSD